VITKAEREADRAIAERVTKPLPWRWWTSNSHRRLKSDDAPGEVAYGTKQRDGGVDDIVIDERDMAAIENAVNRLPKYIADAEEMDQRIEAAERAYAEAVKTEDEESALPEGMLRVLRILRGEP
jgi:hypothetical protein